MTRIRKALHRNDKGFTLIELLVVIVIIGILAAIAIPIFLSQRGKAVEAGQKSDVRTIATEMETYYTDSQAYPATVTGAGTSASPLLFGTDAVVLSPGDTAAIKANGTATAYCIVVSNTKSPQNWVWKSDAGGLQASTTTDCSAGGYTATVL